MYKNKLEEATTQITERKKEKETPYREDILKSIGSSEGMNPYNGEVGIYGVRDSTRQELPSKVRAEFHLPNG